MASLSNHVKALYVNMNKLFCTATYVSVPLDYSTDYNPETKHKFLHILYSGKVWWSKLW